MRILWICNLILPIVAKHLNKEANVKEGWISGLADQVLAHSKESGVELAVCFPVDGDMAGYRESFTVDVKGQACELTAYGFFEDTVCPERYDSNLEDTLRNIFEDYKPDVIHCFGTEYPHTLAAVKVCPDRKRVLLGIQGICYALAEVYCMGLPGKVQKRFTFRDFIKKDNIALQQKKFYMRGRSEKEALRLAGNVTGRTKWDKDTVLAVNPELKYFHMNETLRPDFYKDCWEYEKCKPHSIFLSQGDYPIKGLHYVLKALPKIIKVYPDTHVYVAGQSIIRYSTLKEKIKISSYGKYLLQLIKELGLADKVTFLGKLSAEEMKNQYLASHLFLCSSVLENSPNSLGEAMLLGMPCVAAEVGGIPSLINEQEGILYAGGNADALAEAVLAMWQDEEKMLKFASNARKRALCNHDTDSNYHTLMQIYAQICEE